MKLICLVRKNQLLNEILLKGILSMNHFTDMWYNAVLEGILKVSL